MISLRCLSGWSEGGFGGGGFRLFVPKRLGCFVVAALAASGLSRAWAAEGKISYNNQIAPILSENCFHCHGPDSAARKPKKHPLRLDREDFAYEPRDDGKPVIIKGDPRASELVRRISATDDDIMPPASEQKKLKPSEIALLREWIAQGGKYEKHWSLIPPRGRRCRRTGQAGRAIRLTASSRASWPRRVWHPTRRKKRPAFTGG